MSKTAEIIVALHVNRPEGRSVLMSLDGEIANARWIPRSQIMSLHETGRTTTGTDRTAQKVRLPMAHVTVPEWLAVKEGLV